jgi:hypothetical protein
MSVTQTVDIPTSHQLTIEVPREVPAGRAVLAFFPVANTYKADNLRGLAKKMGSTLTTERFLEMRQEDLHLEEERYRKFSRENG